MLVEFNFWTLSCLPQKNIWVAYRIFLISSVKTKTLKIRQEEIPENYVTLYSSLLSWITSAARDNISELFKKGEMADLIGWLCLFSGLLASSLRRDNEYINSSMTEPEDGASRSEG